MMIDALTQGPSETRDVSELLIQRIAASEKAG